MDARRLRHLDVDGVRPAIIGTILWAGLAIAATLAGGFPGGFLRDRGILWWRDVAWAGFCIGLIGIRHVVRRRNRLRDGE